MRVFILHLLLCSANMTLLALIYAVLSKLLRNVQSARWRYFSWIFLGAGFLTPYKPRLFDPIIELDPEKFTGRISGGYNDAMAPVYETVTRESGIVLPDIWQTLFLIWLAGVILVLGCIAVRQASFT